jgi:hypothetical protein
MATFFRTKIEKEIGTTPVDVLDTGILSRFTVIGCNLANVTDYEVIIDIQIVSPDDTAYYIKQLAIAPYTSAKLITNGEKLIMAENYQMRIVSDTEDSIDAVISYAEIQ